MGTGKRLLEGRKILLVEDNYSIATIIAKLLARHGASMIGPCNTVESALAVVASPARIDGALLDIQVQEKQVYPVAEALREKDVPMVFVTGYSEACIDPAFSWVPCVTKPWSAEHLVKLLGEVTARRLATSSPASWVY